MKNWMFFVGLAGLALGWGYYGGQQAKKQEYQCQVRVESLCFLWELSDIGKTVSPMGGRLDRMMPPTQ